MTYDDASASNGTRSRTAQSEHGNHGFSLRKSCTAHKERVDSRRSADNGCEDLRRKLHNELVALC
jgi:hypothetical protein